MLVSRENSSLHAEHPQAQQTVVNLRQSDGRHETVLLPDGHEMNPKKGSTKQKTPTVNINGGGAISRRRGDDPDEDAGFVEEELDDSQCLAPGDRKMSRESWQSTSRSSHSSITCKNTTAPPEPVIQAVTSDTLTSQAPRRAECVTNSHGVVIRINADSDLPVNPQVVDGSKSPRAEDNSIRNLPPAYGGTSGMTVRQAREQQQKTHRMRKAFASGGSSGSSETPRTVHPAPPPPRLAFSSCNLNRDPSHEELVIPDVFVRSHSLSPGETSLDEDDIRTICAVTDLPPNSPMLMTPSTSRFSFSKQTPQQSPTQSPHLSPNEQLTPTADEDEVFSGTASVRRKEFKANRSDNLTLQPESGVGRSDSKTLLTTQSMDRSESQSRLTPQGGVDRSQSQSHLAAPCSVDRSESQNSLTPGSMDRSESQQRLNPDGSRRKKRRKSNRSINEHEPLKSPWLRSENQIKLAAQRWKIAAKATSLEKSEEVRRCCCLCSK